MRSKEFHKNDFLKGVIGGNGGNIGGNGTISDIVIGAHRDSVKNEESWIGYCRSMGFIAAHPNDGLVDRVNCSIKIQYPYYYDRVMVPGDRLMIGFAWDKKSYLPAEIIELQPNMFGDFVTYYFKLLKFYFDENGNLRIE